MQLMKKAQKAAERKARKSAKTPVKQAQSSSKAGAKKAKIMMDGEEPGPSGQNQESSSKVS